MYNPLKTIKIEHSGDEGIVELVLKFVKEGKKVIVFNRSKGGAERMAEQLYGALTNEITLCEEIASVLEGIETGKTDLVRKLMRFSRHRIGFHHAGLSDTERKIIEEGFDKGELLCISSTSTLMSGSMKGAEVLIIKDYRRYTARGLSDIPAFEYLQLLGNLSHSSSGHGRVIIYVRNAQDEERVCQKYFFNQDHEVTSKLAVAPVLRLYVLALLCQEKVVSIEDMMVFFTKTLHAHQYNDDDALKEHIMESLSILEENNIVFQERDNKQTYYFVTALGKKINELYIDPLTGAFLDDFLPIFKKLYHQEEHGVEGLLFFFIRQREMKPLFYVTQEEEQTYYKESQRMSFIQEHGDIVKDDFESMLRAVKTVLALKDWVNEKTIDEITRKHRISQGELQFKVDRVVQLLESFEAISELKKEQLVAKHAHMIAKRFMYGVKFELLDLMQLEVMNKSVARLLFTNGITSLQVLKSVSTVQLAHIVGESRAKQLKEASGNEYRTEEKGLLDY